jgi:hypothetical protein
MKQRILTVLAAAALVAGTAHRAVAAERVACSTPAPNTKVCRIDEPNVKVPSENFPQVTYQPGDDVTVDAGGCAQTGGHGKTWKRYVDPQGPSSDRLYHGLIWLPGAMNGMQRIGTAHQTFHVAPTIAPNLTFLRLGYEDGASDYGDNGYWGHDDGTGDQCKNSVNAFVVLTIVHHAAPATPAPVSHKPLDLVNAGFDDNGLPFEAAFAYESGGVLKSTADLCPSGLDQCTSQPLSVDTPNWLKTALPWMCSTGFTAPYDKGEHVNWSTGTFAGKVFWQERAWSDDDYNMWLIGSTGPFAVPLTSGNGTTPMPGSTAHAIGLEYDSDETIDHFSTSWWSAWHNAVDQTIIAPSKPHAMVDGSDAVVVGLVGLDCVHDCVAEVHPVYALAMRVPDHPAGVDRWSYFVRNQGDEGMCSEEQHHLEAPALVLRLHPPAPNLHHFTVANSEALDDDPAIGLTFDADGGDALVIVTMPNQNQTERLNGVLDLRWTP